MPDGNSPIERCEAASLAAGEFRKPCIGNVRPSRYCRGFDVTIAEASPPKFRRLHRVNGTEHSPSNHRFAIGRKPQIQSQHRSFGNGARSKRLSLRIEPSSGAVVKLMGVNRQRDQQVAIKEARHARSASPSMRATSADPKGIMPLEIGKPRSLIRAGQATAGTKVPATFPWSRISMGSCCPNARSTIAGSRWISSSVTLCMKIHSHNGAAASRVN